MALLGGASLLLWRRSDSVPEPVPARTSASAELEAPERRVRRLAPRALADAVPQEGGGEGGAEAKERARIEAESFDPGPGPYIELYRGKSGRLSPHARTSGADVIAQTRSAGDAPIVVTWLPTIRAQSGKDLVLRARVLGADGEPIPASSMVVEVFPSLGVEGERLAGSMILTRSAGGAAYEFRFRAPTITPTAEAPGIMDYGYQVLAQGSYDGREFERHVRGMFQIHAPGGHVDPEAVAVEKNGGDLFVRFRARIEREGAYWAYAELWGGPEGDSPIAFGRQRWEKLEPGQHSLSLLFGGQVIRDSGVDGPYVVRSLKLMQVDTIPPHEQDPLPALPSTPAWKASEFH